MAKNKGICRNKKCSNPVSEFDEANALRLGYAMIIISYGSEIKRIVGSGIFVV